MSRIKLDLPSEFPFSITLPIRITDLNYGNHLGNDAVLGLVHEARVQWLNSLGYPSELEVEGVGLIMTDAGIQFKGEGHYGVNLKIEVASQVVGLGFDLYYRISELDTNKPIAFIKTGMLCFDYDKRKPVAIPALLAAKLDA